MFKDEDFQLDVLKQAKDAYPGPIIPNSNHQFFNMDVQKFIYNIKELMNKDLLDEKALILGVDADSSGKGVSIGHMAITEKGIQYLDLVEELDKITTENETKNKILQYAKELPLNILKDLVTQLAVKGIEFVTKHFISQ